MSEARGKGIRIPVLEAVNDLLVEVAALAADHLSDWEGETVDADMTGRLEARLTTGIDGTGWAGWAFYDGYRKLDALLRKLDPEAVYLRGGQ